MARDGFWFLRRRYSSANEEIRHAARKQSKYTDKQKRQAEHNESGY
jgi:hypothetical protein